MSETPPCPKFASEYSYELGTMQLCSMCAHEWSPAAAREEVSKWSFSW